MAGSDRSDYGHTLKASRLPPLPTVLDPSLQEHFDRILARGGQILNLHRVSGHAPRLAGPRGEFAWALRDACGVARQMRELVIMRVACLMGCDYELHHHVPLARRAGLTEAQIEALGDWQRAQQLFSAPQVALLTYLDAMFHHQGDVDDAVFAALSAHFQPREIVELTTCASYYLANAFFVKALGVEIDRPGVGSAPGRF